MGIKHLDQLNNIMSEVETEVLNKLKQTNLETSETNEQKEKILAFTSKVLANLEGNKFNEFRNTLLWAYKKELIRVKIGQNENCPLSAFYVLLLEPQL